MVAKAAMAATGTDASILGMRCWCVYDRGERAFVVLCWFCGIGDSRRIRAKGTRWMPWHLGPKKDVARQRNASGSRGQAMIRGYPNGATPLESYPGTPG